MASDNDYYPFQNDLLIVPSMTPLGGQVCTSVIVIGDDVLELDELFQVAIVAEDSNDVVPLVFRINIVNDDDGGDGEMILFIAHHLAFH